MKPTGESSTGGKFATLDELNLLARRFAARPAPAKYKCSRGTWWDLKALVPNDYTQPRGLAQPQVGFADQTLMGVPVEFDETIERGYILPVEK